MPPKNYDQLEESATALTPVQKFNTKLGDIYLKRDDLCNIGGASGGKARTCWALSKTATRGLTTAGSRHSPQVFLVATMARILGLPFVAHIPHGTVSLPISMAVALGAQLKRHKPGYNTVIVKRCQEFASFSGYTEIPFGMECDEAVTQTRKQVANLPPDIRRIVVPVGSGMSLCGILHGLRDHGRATPVLGVRVGGDPAVRLSKYAPADISNLKLVTSPHPYHYHLPASIGSIPLDPVYEAKTAPYLRGGDLLWIVGHRNSSQVTQINEWNG